MGDRGACDGDSSVVEVSAATRDRNEGLFPHLLFVVPLYLNLAVHSQVCVAHARVHAAEGGTPGDATRLPGDQVQAPTLDVADVAIAVGVELHRQVDLLVELQMSRLRPLDVDALDDLVHERDKAPTVAQVVRAVEVVREENVTSPQCHSVRLLVVHNHVPDRAAPHNASRVGVDEVAEQDALHGDAATHSLSRSSAGSDAVQQKDCPRSAAEHEAARRACDRAVLQLSDGQSPAGPHQLARDAHLGGAQARYCIGEPHLCVARTCAGALADVSVACAFTAFHFGKRTRLYEIVKPSIEKSVL